MGVLVAFYLVPQYGVGLVLGQLIHYSLPQMQAEMRQNIPNEKLTDAINDVARYVEVAQWKAAIFLPLSSGYLFVMGLLFVANWKMLALQAHNVRSLSIIDSSGIAISFALAVLLRLFYPVARLKTLSLIIRRLLAAVTISDIKNNFDILPAMLTSCWRDALAVDLAVFIAALIAAGICMINIAHLRRQKENP